MPSSHLLCDILLNAPIIGTYVDTACWTDAEMVLAIVCGCMPTFRPLFTSFFHSIHNFVSNSSLNRFIGGSKSSSKNATEHQGNRFNSVALAKPAPIHKQPASNGFERIGEPDLYDPTAFSEKGAPHHIDDVELGIPVAGIQMHKDMQ